MVFFSFKTHLKLNNQYAVDLRTIMTYSAIFKISAIIILLSLCLTEFILTTTSLCFFKDAHKAMSDTNTKLLDYLEFHKNIRSIESVEILLNIIPWKLFLEATSLIICSIYCMYNSRRNQHEILRKSIQLTLAIMKIGECAVTILMLHYIQLSATYIQSQNLDVQSYFGFEQYSLSITLVRILSITHIGFGITLILTAGITKLIQVLKTRNNHYQFENENSFRYDINENDVERGGFSPPLFRESGNNRELMLSFLTESSLIDQTFDDSVEIIYENLREQSNEDVEKVQSDEEDKEKVQSSSEDGDKVESESVFSEEQLLGKRVRDTITIHSTTSMLRLSYRKK